MTGTTPSTADVARRVGVTPATLKRWVSGGVVPLGDAGWTQGMIAHARIVARLRERGHPLAEIRQATDDGRLAFGYAEDLLRVDEPDYTLAEAAKETGLEPALIERIGSSLGFSVSWTAQITEDDVQMLRYSAAALAAGLPLVAFLQMCRVYGQALAQVADAEVRLFHLYVHEPLMREGIPGLQMAEEMEGLTRQLLPLASPLMDHLHQRFLHHFVEQDVIGHMESDLSETQLDLGRLRVAIAFADLAGYTRLTEEQGEEEAVGAVERFVEAVEHTLPEDARVIKTIGDEVMVVGSDPAALVDWAVGFQSLMTERPLPRIGVHYGETLYRDGDYYGREVNLAARVAARSAGGEVIVTRPLVDAAGPHLEFERIGEVRLKGFTDPTELFLASLIDE
ncbi:guanylate cyclase [Paraconexibacter antarcticus]|uniref:Guanylate cyclase n=1 Tax=Paraconexibacter antarcticus TaxID=2949664 RepID=A0ABY5DVW0_9ACTN|nr:adenylate cyclase regulatory domain-containing protein [Paraconexibacter antarcticus]UTI65801.1 guanylate cyclase [Paraconexibacter antarcticus]